MFEIGFIISAFIAGLLMFLAPCTLPLVPAYLAFISGVKADDFKNPQKIHAAKRAVIINGGAFILGFTGIFVLFGIIAGLLGAQIAQYRILLAQIGGAFIILFGLMMLNVIRIAPLMRDHRMKVPGFLTPGKPSSAFVIGASFAFGWTPCVGPVLASILLLASTSTTAFQGGFLLFVFSIGLAIPFLLTAVLYARAGAVIARMSSVTKWISYIGGVFLILLGLLLLTNNFGLTIEYGYRIFDFINYDALLDYL